MFSHIMIGTNDLARARGFYDAVFVSLDPEGPADAPPVKVELKETLRQKWVMGLGVRSDSGPRLTAEYTQNRLPGLGWRGVTKLSVDKILQSWSLDLLAPLADRHGIAVVDDDEGLLILMAGTLRAEGCAVEPARTARSTSCSFLPSRRTSTSTCSRWRWPRS